MYLVNNASSRKVVVNYNDLEKLHSDNESLSVRVDELLVRTREYIQPSKYQQDLNSRERTGYTSGIKEGKKDILNLSY